MMLPLHPVTRPGAALAVALALLFGLLPPSGALTARAQESPDGARPCAGLTAAGAATPVANEVPAQGSPLPPAEPVATAPTTPTTSITATASSTVPVATVTTAADTADLATLRAEQIGYSDDGFWVARGDGSEPWRADRLPAGEALLAFAWSPDGQRVALLTDQGVYVQPVGSGPPASDQAEVPTFVAIKPAAPAITWQNNTIALLSDEGEGATAHGDHGIKTGVALIDATHLDQPPGKMPGSWVILPTDYRYATIALAPDARRVAFSYANARGVYDVATGAPIFEPGKAQDFLLPTWHPRGNRLYVYGYLESSSAGQEAWRLFPIDAPVRGAGAAGGRPQFRGEFLAFAPDTRLVVYTAPQLTIAAYPVASGAGQLLSSDDAAWPSFSPDGRFVMYVRTVPTDSDSMEPDYAGVRVVAVGDTSSDASTGETAGTAPREILPARVVNAAWRPRPEALSLIPATAAAVTTPTAQPAAQPAAVASAAADEPLPPRALPLQSTGVDGVLRLLAPGRIEDLTWADDMLAAVSDHALYLVDTTPTTVSGAADNAAGALRLMAQALLPESGYTVDLLLADGFLYITGIYDERIVDVRNPAAPRLVADWPSDPTTLGGFMDLALYTVAGRTLAFVANGGVEDRVHGDSLFGSISLFDVTDPAAPLLCGVWPGLGIVRTLTVVDDRLLAGTGGDHNGRGRLGMQIFDLAPETFMETLSFVDLPTGVFGALVLPDVALTAGYVFGQSTLHAVDWSDPFAPTITGAVEEVRLSAAAHDADRLYVVTHSDSGAAVRAFALEAGAVVEVGRGALPAGGHALAPAPDALYVADEGGIALLPLPLPALGDQVAEPAAATAPAALGEAGAETGAAPVGHVVAAGPINVRTGPGTGFQVAMQAEPGTEVVLLERSPDGAWLRVRLPSGAIGWVLGRYVAFEEGEAAEVSVAEVAAAAMAAAPDCPLAIDAALADGWARDDLGCPTAAASITWASYAPFEHGLMLWRRDEGRIYGFFDAGGWQSLPDTWDGASATPARGTPPAGLLEPVRGFGHVWGTNDNFFNNLGWMRDAQKGFCALVQPFESGLLLRSSQVEFCHEENLYNSAREPNFGLNGIKAVEGGGWQRL